jgi:hypothetical protein
MEQLVMQAFGQRPTSSITNPSEIIFESLESILERCPDWGLEIDADDIRIRYYQAKEEDKRIIDSLMNRWEHSTQVKQTPVINKIYISRMGAEGDSAKR